MYRNLVKFGRVVSQIYASTDEQTDRHTRRNTRLPYWSGVANVDLILFLSRRGIWLMLRAWRPFVCLSVCAHGVQQI